MEIEGDTIIMTKPNTPVDTKRDMRVKIRMLPFKQGLFKKPTSVSDRPPGVFQYIEPNPKAIEHGAITASGLDVVVYHNGAPPDQSYGAIDWQPGERSRMVGDTLVYRDYEAYCDV